MPRLPEIGDDEADAVAAAVFEGFAAEGRRPIALYRVLANAPRMLRAYSTLARGLRYEADVPRALRELVILRTAQLVGSDYEWAHHRKMAAAVGIPDEKLAALAQWRDSAVFDDSERAVLELAEETHRVGLTDACFARLEGLFTPGQIVELLLVAAFYQAVARLIQGLGLEIEPDYLPYLSVPEAPDSGS